VSNDGYLARNRANWDERVPAHVASPGYSVERFRADPAFLSDVVRFDLPLLGDVAGARGVHLQCHIGTDTVSLARLGASMTGLDFSGPAVAAATELAREAGADATFVQGEVYDAPDLLERSAFDLVYTGIGALCWLPDVRRWARVVAALLRPGGRLFIREGHPVLWSIDDTRAGDDLLVIRYPWNHGLGEIITALMDAGLAITGLAEHDSVPWEALPGRMERVDGKEWRLAESPARLPHSYTLQALKVGDEP
jgi:SAM-dependent methyltransferase